MVNNLTILGSTGSIGTQTLEVARALNIKVGALAANKSVKLMEEQIREFKPELAALADEKSASELRVRVSDTPCRVLGGEDGITETASYSKADTVMSSLVGMAGIHPTLSAIESGKNVALANKETLVCAGSVIMRRAREKGVRIIPVDSEHSAIFQSLHASCDYKREISRIILTASGGPFYGKTSTELESVTPEEALKHPNWSMGAKVTIDSATLMNKGLEFIEAMWLFDVPPEKIDIVVHRESIIHSMAEFCDGAIIAQLGTPDMRTPISIALTYPERKDFGGNRIDFGSLKNLSFGLPDTDTFRCLALALEAAERGGTAGAILNGANEAAVDLFLKSKIGFTEIPSCIEFARGKIRHIENPSLGEITDASLSAMETVYSMF